MIDELKNKIRIIFTTKADSALDDIMTSFNIEETFKEGELSKIVIIDRLAKDFALGSISEKGLTDSLAKNLSVSQQIAGQISKEIITKVIPFLEKVPEEKLKDPDFVKELEKKIFGEPTKEIKIEPKEEKELDIFPKVEPLVNIEEPKIPTVEPQKKQEKIEKIKKPIAKDSAPQIKRPIGKDTYREPID